MATEITKTSQAPLSFNALSPRQRLVHRARVGVKSKAILGQFWTDAKPDDDVLIAELQGWMDVLQDCGEDEVAAAWTLYQNAGPRTAAGKLYKPDAGYLWRIVMAAREQGWPAQGHAAFIANIFALPDPDEERRRANYRRIIEDAEAANNRGRA